jgi:cell fate (sporulation/competence/biofilm development) regulator YlbF (YheA/YmcA/DUF963 family)
MEIDTKQGDGALEAYRRAAARLKEIDEMLNGPHSHADHERAYEEMEAIIQELNQYGDPDAMP